MVNGARPLVAAGLAVLLLVVLAAYEHGQAGSAAVLQQRLDPAVHKALLSLATNLEGELRGVQGVLSAVDGEAKVEVRGEALASQAKAEPAPSEGSCLGHETPASTWVTAKHLSGPSTFSVSQYRDWGDWRRASHLPEYRL